MSGQIVLARRASPNWKKLAIDYAAGLHVPAESYFPFHDLRFDRRIPQLVDQWNALSRISYFACRARLCEIAAANLSKVLHAELIDRADVGAFIHAPLSNDTLLFYHDDDDWFSPDLAIAMAEVDPKTIDAVVFPFVRLASNVTTFTADGVPIAESLGQVEAFRYRYCTNNYGLSGRALLRGADLVEHTDASQAANALGFNDLHIGTVLSATSKTPCSASWILHLPDNRSAFERHILRYIEALEKLRIPPSLAWLEAPLGQTLALFREA